MWENVNCTTQVDRCGGILPHGESVLLAGNLDMPIFEEAAVCLANRLGDGKAKKQKFIVKKVLLVASIAALAAFSEGCAAIAPISSAVGALNPQNTLQIFNTTELRLQQRNFVVVKANVIGQSKGFALLGFITIVPAKFNKAMNQLNAQADLKPGSSRTLANLVLEKDSSYWVLFGIPRTSIRADVVEFIDNVPAKKPAGIAKANTTAMQPVIPPKTSGP